MIKIIGVGLSCSVLLLFGCQQQIPNTNSTEPQESESQQQTSNTNSIEPQESESQQQTPNTNSTESQSQAKEKNREQKEKNSHKLGDPIEVEGRVVRITEVIRDVKISYANPIGEYVIVRGKITNISNKTGDLAWSYFRLKDSDGRIYKKGSWSENYGARKKYNAKSPSTDVPPGMSIEFVIAFDVTPDATGLELVWKSGALDAQEQYVSLGASSYSNEVSFDIRNYPLNSCGDHLPQDASQYPVKLFPVFVRYSNEELATIKSNYCKDAFKKTTDNGEQVVQVASFIKRDRASKFLLFLFNRGQRAEVGEPIVITEPNQ